jgi:hypothetical protein
MEMAEEPCRNRLLRFDRSLLFHWNAGMELRKGDWTLIIQHRAQVRNCPGVFVFLSSWIFTISFSDGYFLETRTRL